MDKFEDLIKSPIWVLVPGRVERWNGGRHGAHRIFKRSDERACTVICGEGADMINCGPLDPAAEPSDNTAVFIPTRDKRRVLLALEDLCKKIRFELTIGGAGDERPERSDS